MRKRIQQLRTSLLYGLFGGMCSLAGLLLANPSTLHWPIQSILRSGLVGTLFGLVCIVTVFLLAWGVQGAAKVLWPKIRSDLSKPDTEEEQGTIGPW